MSENEHPMARLAERGEERGADQVLRSARAEAGGQHQPGRRWIPAAAAVLAAAAVVVGVLVAADGSGDAPVTAGEPDYVEDPEPVVAPVSPVDGPFEVEYRESNLGAELTDDEGAVVQPATLEEDAYRLTYRSAEDWEVRNLDTGDRVVYTNGVLQDWRDGEIVSEARRDDLAVSAPFAMPLDVDEFHDHMDEREFTQVERSSQDGAVREVYERLIPRPEGEYYQSLPWRDDGNVDQITVDYDQQTGRVVDYVQRLNGQTTYRYELVSASATDPAEAGALAPLVELLLDDDDVLQVVPELVPKAEYSTGESYGRITDEELVGPTAGAVAGVVRQWSLADGTAGAGVPGESPSGAGEEAPDTPITVISTVVQFPTADAADDAADAVLGLLPGSATDIGGSSVRSKTTEVEVDFSDGVAVTTAGPFLVAVQVGFAGGAGRSVLTGLADAVAAQVASVSGTSGADPAGLASFCAAAPDSSEEVPESYIGSAEQVEDLRMLRTAAPVDLHAELDLLVEHFDEAVDPADPDSQLVENFPDDVAAAIAVVTGYIDDNCGT